MASSLRVVGPTGDTFLADPAGCPYLFLHAPGVMVRHTAPVRSFAPRPNEAIALTSPAVRRSRSDHLDPVGARPSARPLDGDDAWGLSPRWARRTVVTIHPRIKRRMTPNGLWGQMGFFAQLFAGSRECLDAPHLISGSDNE